MLSSGNDNSSPKVISAIANVCGLDIPLTNSDYPFLSVAHAILDFEEYRNLRMYGHYIKIPGARKNIINEMGIGDEIFKMYPCDNTAELFQQFFASPVGLVIKKSDKKLPDHFTPKSIGKIFAIVHADGFYDLEQEAMLVGDIKTNKAVWKLIEAVLPDNKQGRFIKNKVARSMEWNVNKFDEKVAFKPAVNNVLKYLEPRMRLLLESFKENANGKGGEIGYPSYVVEKILLIYMWELHKDNTPLLEPYYLELLSAGMIKKEFLNKVKFSKDSAYTEDDFRSCRARTPLEAKILEKYAFMYFLDNLSPVVQFGMSNIIEDNGQSVDYSDCGDTSLRDLLMMFLFDGKKFNTDRLRELRRHGFNVSELMIHYFEEICPTPAHVNTDIARIFWSAVVNRLNKPGDKHKAEYVAPTPPGVSKEEYVDGYYGINTGFRNILMVLIKLFGEPKRKNSDEYFFSMEMKTRLECIQNIDKLCYLMSDADLNQEYPTHKPIDCSKYWSVKVADYIDEANLELEELQKPTPKDGWVGLTLTFTKTVRVFTKQKKGEYEWHIDARHYDFNRKEYKPVDKSEIITIDDIYSLKMDSAKEKIVALDCMLDYAARTGKTVFQYLLNNWLDKDSIYFAGWKNRKLNLKLVQVLLKYWSVDKILGYGITELHGALVCALVGSNRFSEIMHVLEADARCMPEVPVAVDASFATKARALAQTLKSCNDEELLKLRDLGVNGYCQKVLGTTLLHLVASAGNVRLTTSLSKLGIHLDQTDREGKTAVHRAIASNCPVTVVNLLNQNASIPRFSYLDLLVFTASQASRLVMQFAEPSHPTTCAGNEVIDHEEKHKITSSIQFVKGIETSRWLAANEIQDILSQFKFNYLNIYHDNALLLKCASDITSADNYYDLAFKDDFCAKVCSVQRTKYLEKNLTGEGNGYNSLYKQSIFPENSKYQDFPALVLPRIFQLETHTKPFFDMVEKAIHYMFLVFLYDDKTGKIYTDKLSALADRGFQVNAELITYFDKVAKDKEYIHTEKGSREWLAVVSSLNKNNKKFKVKYRPDGSIASGVKNILRVFGGLLGQPACFDMEMRTKYACLKNLNLICYLFSENELGEWNPNTYKKYWTVSITNYGFEEDQDACSLYEPLAENQDWTGISFIFSYGSMSKNRSPLLELYVENDVCSINRTPIAFYLSRLADTPKMRVQEFLKTTSNDVSRWRNRDINLLVIGMLLNSYTIEEILSFDVPFLHDLLLFIAVKSKSETDAKLVLAKDSGNNENQANIVSFSAMAGTLAYTLRHADGDDLQVLLKAGAGQYATRVIGIPLLHLIAASGNASLLTAMLETCQDINIKDSDGRAPLHYAAATRLNSSAMVSILLENGANINAVDNNLESPLFIIADQIRNEVVRIRMVASLFLFRDKFCDLPGVDISIFELLIKAGAYFDINYRDDMNFLDFAMEYCNKSVVELMHKQLLAAISLNSNNEMRNLFEPSPADKYHPGDALAIISFIGSGPRGFIGATEMACHYLHNNREWCRPHIQGNTIYGFYFNVVPMLKDMQEDIRKMFPAIAKFSDEEFGEEVRKEYFKDEKSSAAFYKLLEDRFGKYIVVRPRIRSAEQRVNETKERQLKYFFSMFKPEAKVTCVVPVVSEDGDVDFLVSNHDKTKKSAWL